MNLIKKIVKKIVNNKPIKAKALDAIICTKYVLVWMYIGILFSPLLFSMNVYAASNYTLYEDESSSDEESVMDERVGGVPTSSQILAGLGNACYDSDIPIFGSTFGGMFWSISREVIILNGGDEATLDYLEALNGDGSFAEIRTAEDLDQIIKILYDAGFSVDDINSTLSAILQECFKANTPYQAYPVFSPTNLVISRCASQEQYNTVMAYFKSYDFCTISRYGNNMYICNLSDFDGAFVGDFEKLDDCYYSFVEPSYQCCYSNFPIFYGQDLKYAYLEGVRVSSDGTAYEMSFSDMTRCGYQSNWGWFYSYTGADKEVLVCRDKNAYTDFLDGRINYLSCQYLKQLSDLENVDYAELQRRMQAVLNSGDWTTPQELQRLLDDCVTGYIKDIGSGVTELTSQMDELIELVDKGLIDETGHPYMGLSIEELRDINERLKNLNLTFDEFKRLYSDNSADLEDILKNLEYLPKIYELMEENYGSGGNNYLIDLPDPDGVIDLSNNILSKFPFSIVADVGMCLDLVSADPQEPRWLLPMPYCEVDTLEIDLTWWEDIRPYVNTFLCVGFCIFLLRLSFKILVSLGEVLR